MTETSVPGTSYDAAVIDLLGAIAYGELSAFERLVGDARMAPLLADKIALDGMAAAQFALLQPLLGRLQELGADPTDAMEPFVVPFDSFHEMTAPNDWLESLIKAYVGDSLASDFYREIAALLDERTRDLIIGTLSNEGQADFVIERVRGAIDADPRVAGRLALWARRLMGEALSQAQRVAAERDALIGLLGGTHGGPGLDLAAMGQMFHRLTEAHKARMARLGLEP